MTDYQQFSHGGATFPLTSSTLNSLLLEADPSLYYVLDYFQSVINTHLGARFTAELARGPTMVNSQGQAYPIVNGAVPLDPTPWLLEQQFKFPLLAVYRSSAKYNWHTLTWMRDDSTWGVSYTLPPITGGQAERLMPILRAVEVVLLNRIEAMMDPAYNSGLLVWQKANLQEIFLVESSFGYMPAGNGLSFPQWNAKLMVKERDMAPPAGAFQVFGGIDAEVDELAGGNAPAVADFIDGKVDFVDATTIPTLAALYQADAGVSFAADRFHVSAIADQSGNGITAAPGTASNQPTLIKAAIVTNPATLATKPLLRFDGALSYLSSTVPALANDAGKTFVVLFRLGDLTKRSAILAHTLAADTGAHTSAIEANTLSTAGGELGFYADGSSYDTTLPTDSGLHVAVVRESATTNAGSITATTTYQVDGSPSLTLTNKSGAGTWGSMATANLLVVGGNPALLSTTAASCDVGVWMAFSSRLSDADTQKAILFCRQWAGLT